MPKGGKSKKGRGRRGRDDDDYGYARSDQKLQRPADQEKLTSDQLKEEFIKTLTALDTSRNKNRVVWDFNDRAWVPYVDEEETVVMIHLDSELVFKDVAEEELKDYPYPTSEEIEDPEEAVKLEALKKEEAKREALKKEKELKEEQLQSAAGTAGQPPAAAPPGAAAADAPPDGEAPKPEEGEDTEEKVMEDIPEDKPVKLLNQFNFCERASQTNNNPVREHSAQTQPPPRSQYRDYCNQWVIYDAYEADVENRPKAGVRGPGGGGVGEEDPAAAAAGGGEGGEEAVGGEGGEGGEKKEKKVKEKDKEGKISERERVRLRKPSIIEGQAAQEAALAKSAEGLKILERLVMQNVHNEVLTDFKYYEDASDEFRETGEGTLLPLWKFAYDRAKKHHITSVSWALTEPDVFAVSYGSFNFMHPIVDGMVLVWSLRNSAFPEYVWLAPKGVMSCQMHPNQSCLICVGLYDGNVAMVQLREDEEGGSKSQVMRNSHTLMKHRAPIWSVRWVQNDMEEWPEFYSGAMDGQIIHWVVDPSAASTGGGLTGTSIATLHLPLPPVPGPDGTTYQLFGCARCMAFHPKERTTFLVGTAEGNIFRCSMLYGSRFQQIYNAHFLPVAALEWNHYHPDVFLSCSEDWTIKIWDRNDLEPMYVFEIGVAILDAAWAPYSSTVFAAVSEEGKALVYDLNVNKEKPICCQQVVTKKKVRPNRIAFNPYYPLLIVGDDRGQLTTLKLSPNLRLMPKDAKGGNLEGETRTLFEVNKMTKLLSLVRDPESVTANAMKLLVTDEKQAKNVLAAMTAQPIK